MALVGLRKPTSVTQINPQTTWWIVKNPTPIDVERLAQAVDTFEGRLLALEVLAGIKPAPPVPIEPLPVPVEPIPVPIEPTPVPLPRVPTEPMPAPVEPLPVEPLPLPRVPVEPPPAVPAPGSFEFRLGTQGALYAGLLLLLIGAASLVAWGYQYMGPAFKIGAGLAMAASMIAGGELLIRKRENMKWYGTGLIGGGYAFGYFLFYAMQNIASVKILDSVLIDSVLLLGWAGVTMLHSLVRKSENIALLSTLLAFVTISLSPLGFFSVCASAIMAVGLAWVVVRMDWLKVYSLGAVGSYLTYLFFTQPQINAIQGGTDAGFWLSGAFLGVFWLVYNAVAFYLKPSTNGTASRRTTILGVLVLNAVGFVLPSLYSMGTFLPEWRWLFLALVGVVYFGFTKLASSRGLRDISQLTLLLGLQCVTAAVPLKLDPMAVSAVWFLECALLVFAGLRQNLLPFRWFAAALAAFTVGRLVLVDLENAHTFNLLGLAVDWRWLIGTVAAASYGFAAWCYRSARFEAVKTTYEKLAGYPLFMILAGVAAWVVPAFAAPVGLKALFWSVEGAALVLLGIRMRDWLAQELASLAFLTAGISLAVNYAVVSTPVLSCVIGLFYVASFAFRFASPVLAPGAGRARYHAYALASVVLTYLLTWLRASDPVSLALSLAFESGLIVLLGFQLKDSAIRRLGTVGLVPVIVALVLGLSTWTWGGVLPVVAIIFALHARYRMGWDVDERTTDTFLDELGRHLGADENEYVKRAYFVVGTALLTAVFSVLVEPVWLPLVLSCQFALTVGAGFVLGERHTRLVGAAGFVPVALALVGSLSFWSWVGVAPTIGILMAVYVGYRFGNLRTSERENTELDRQLGLLLREGESQFFRKFFAIFVSLLATVCFLQLLDPRILAVAWALEGLVLVALGFGALEKIFRQGGLVVLCLLTLKLLFIDFSGAETLERILSFIAAGLVWLAVSFGYGWLNKRFAASGDRE